jgi:hypothetical protein
MAALTLIIKTDRSGRLSIERTPPGLTHAKADAEVSRLNFRNDSASYCTYTGLFDSVEQASEYVRCRNAGMSPEAAMKRAKPKTR